MRRLTPQLVAVFVLAGLLAAGAGNAQTGPPTPPLPAGSAAPVASVNAVTIVPDKDGLSVEILSNRPLIPTLKKLESPPRLVIDLPNSNLTVRRKRIDFRSEEVSGIRADQFQNAPPIARVVVDLLKPVRYTWDAAGNRLTVRLRPVEEDVMAKPPTVPAFTVGAQPVAVPLAPGSSGVVVLAGSRVAAGSSVTAGADTAILRLARGGEVRVCPGTTVSVASSQSGRDLMLGMSTGALEAHYMLDASADSVLTPDFRILLAGPGEFHYAVSADSRGNTCVRTLPGNTASAIVTELMGDGTYQVKPAEQVVFHSGRLSQADVTVPATCGCPAPAVPIMRASVLSGPVISDADLPASMRLAQPGDVMKPVPPPVSMAGLRTSGAPPAQVTLSVAPPETAALPPPQPNEVRVQVDAPFIFRASDPPPVLPDLTLVAEQLPLAYSRRDPPLETVALRPQLEVRAKPKHTGFFGKIKGFFAAIFR